MSVSGIKNKAKIGSSLVTGPIALIRNEDDTNLDSTIRHHREIGFPNIVVLTEKPMEGSSEIAVVVPSDLSLGAAVNDLMEEFAGRWIFAAHNAEYLYFPFSDTRSVMDLFQFISEERRDSVSCISVDLYPSKYERGTATYSVDDAWFDASGYYSTDRYEGPNRLDRQIDVFGGLRWRYSEHIPWERQSINRPALFRAAEGLRMDENGFFNEPEYNTLSCPWHNSLTAAVASFRAAKSLLQNPGSTYEIESLIWENSKQFDWTNKQLMELGIIEPGQWF